MLLRREALLARERAEILLPSLSEDLADMLSLLCLCPAYISRLVLRSVCGSWEAEGRQECTLIGSGRLRSSAASACSMLLLFAGS